MSGMMPNSLRPLTTKQLWSASRTRSDTPLRRLCVEVRQERQYHAKHSYATTSVEARDVKTESLGPSLHSTQSPALARLPTINIVRSLVLGALFTSPTLLRLGFAVLQRTTTSSSIVWNPDRNPILRMFVKPLVYDQFCAGTKISEIERTREKIRRIGFAGVILCYGKEILVADSDKTTSSGQSDEARDREINNWKEGNLQTLAMIGRGDWLGMKYTGAGKRVTDALIRNEPPPHELVDAMNAICQKALTQECRIWVDAEQQVLQTAIDNWTVDFMRRYNKGDKALVYNTIQAYLKASRANLKRQLAIANKEGWTLAVKLVRGAYIGSDPRELIHDTKVETDDCYNSIIQDLLTGTNLAVETEKSPKVQLFIAGHNAESIAGASYLIRDLSRRGTLKILPDFGQLQGMADEVGCNLLQHFEDLESEESRHDGTAVPRVYKCLTWGTTQECMGFLIRRMVENSGGAARMRDGRKAYVAELRRRTFAMVGLQR